MSTHDMNIANQGFPAFRSDLNNALAALASNSSSATEPSTTFANQTWFDTTNNLLMLRNKDNDAWVTLAYIDPTADTVEWRGTGVQAVDSNGLTFQTDDGTTRLTIADDGEISFQNYSFPTADGSNGQALITDGSGNLSFGTVGGDKIEEGNSSVEVVDTGLGHVKVTTDGTERLRVDSSGNVGIGTSSPDNLLHIRGGAATLEIDSSTNTANIDFDNSVETARIQLANDYLRALVGGSERMRLDSNGNLKFNSGYGSVATAYGVRAWINFNGDGTISIRESGNVSSIADRGTGLYTVNFSNSMPDNDYQGQGSTQDQANDATTRNRMVSVVPWSSSQAYLNTFTTSGGVDDCEIVQASFVR